MVSFCEKLINLMARSGMFSISKALPNHTEVAMAISEKAVEIKTSVKTKLSEIVGKTSICAMFQ